MPLARTWLTPLLDDSGSGTDGSPIDKDLLTDFADDIDATTGLVAGKNYINDTANASMTVGLTINQGTADDEIVSLKSSDVAHGASSETETDTYGRHGKADAALGGYHILGIAESTGATGLKLTGAASSVTTKSTSATGSVQVHGREVDGGAGFGTMDANANLLVVCADAGTARFILDAEGDSHQDGTGWTNYDVHDDVSVLNLLTAYVTRPDDPLRATFAHWLLQSRETLERLRLVTFNEDGHHFVNMSRLTMLLVGAVRQLGTRVDQVERRLALLDA